MPPHSLRRRWLLGAVSTRFLATLVTSAYIAIGITLLLQPDRYANTPSYAVLLEIFNQFVWGLVYLIVAAALGASVVAADQPYGRALAVTAHTVAIALTAAWLGAFVVRWLSDDGTTVVNIVSWGVYLALLIRSALQLDGPEPAGAVT